MKKMFYIFALFFCFALLAGAADNSDFSNNRMSYHTSEASGNLDRETDRFLKAKEFVFNREWKKAKDRLTDYIKAYPQGTYADEAYYWLAQSLNKLSKTGNSLDYILLIKQDAYQNLSHLIQNYPTSMWTDDAQSLRYQLAAELATLGNPKQQMLVQEIVSSQKETDRKNTALNAVAEFRADVKIPILKHLLEIEKDSSLRKRYLYILAEHDTEEIMLLLHTIAEEDSDPTIRDEAASLIELKEMENIPVQLNYFGFSATSTDKDVQRKLPENKISVFTLPRTNLRNKRGIEKAVKKMFNNKLKDLNLVAFSHDAYQMLWDINARTRKEISSQIKMVIEKTVKEGARTDIIDLSQLSLGSTSHRIQGFQIYPIVEGIKKEFDQISGVLMVRNLDTDKENFSSYQVDNSVDQLFAVRKGDGIALIVFQFESEEKETKQPIYTTNFSNVMGCNILSSRSTWHLDELSHIMDFGLSKAKIPYKNSNWTLIGYIVSDPKNKRLIGRNAELKDATGKRIVKAAQIFVPVDNPSKYETVGKSKAD